MHEVAIPLFRIPMNSKEPLLVEETPEGIIFSVRVQPRASKREISGIQGDALKVRLTAPPVEGAANAQCRKLLAEALQVNISHITILSGLQGRLKRVRVIGITKEKFFNLLSPFLHH